MIMPESNTTSIVWTTSKDDTTTEFDDSPEADLIRKCDEADRTGNIPECTWVRKYWVTITLSLWVIDYENITWTEIPIQMTRDCREKWRAKCHHVRHGGLLTNPPPTTMIMPESNTTSIVWTTSATTIEQRCWDSHVTSRCISAIEEKMLKNESDKSLKTYNYIKMDIFSSENVPGLDKISVLFLFIINHQ